MTDQQTARPKEFLASTGGSPSPTNEMDPARLQFIPETAEDRDLLVAWLTTDTWPFHGNPTLTEAQVRGMLDEGDGGQDSDRLSVWVTLDEAVRVGRIVVEDLEDLTAVASFRIRSAYRGRGIGLQMVRWVAETVFRDHPGVQRIEGQTRADNHAMQRVFRRAGWQPEAFYRRSWPDPSGTLHDAIGYAVLRSEWESGQPALLPATFDQWDATPTTAPESQAFFDLATLDAARRALGEDYHEFFSIPVMSMGLYVLPTDGVDSQSPHHEDEVYVVSAGRGMISIDGVDTAIAPGSIIFVAAQAVHRFHSITEELSLIVFFAPAYSGS